MISEMIYDMAVVDSEGEGACTPLWASTFIFFIMQHLCFDNTLYFHITLMPYGVIVLWSAFI